MIEAIKFSSFGEFLDMGGYAFNVWAVYGLFAVFLWANLFLPLRKRKRIMREQKRRLLINNSDNDDRSTEFDSGDDSLGENR